MDLALLLIAAKAFLEKEGPTATFFDLPPETKKKEDIAPSVPIPKCALGEKLTWIPGQQRYVCLPSLK